jgi:hypothetical protein
LNMASRNTFQPSHVPPIGNDLISSLSFEVWGPLGNPTSAEGTHCIRDGVLQGGV